MEFRIGAIEFEFVLATDTETSSAQVSEVR